MTVSENTVRQLLREYFEDYIIEDRFLYTFGGEQFLVTECLTRSGGVSKNGILELLNEYFDNYHVKDNFIVDMHRCHFLVGLQTAILKGHAKGQKRIDPSKSSTVFNRSDLIDNPDDLMYCNILNKYCAHADKDNNREIGFEVCHGEYCDDTPIPKKSKEIDIHIFDDI